MTPATTAPFDEPEYAAELALADAYEHEHEKEAS